MIKTYFPFFAKYKKAFLFAPLLVILDVICEIVQPYLMSGIVDVGVKQQNIALILQTGGLMIGLSLIAITANVGNIYYSSSTSVGFAAELRKGLFSKIQQFSFSNLEKFGSATLTTRITNDVNILQEVVLMSLRLLIRAPLMLLFAIVLAIQINSGLFFVIAIAISVLSVSIYFIMRYGFPFFEQMQYKLDKLNTVVQENLLNVRVVKSFVREKFEIEKFVISSNELRDIAIKASGAVILIMPVMQLVMNTSIVAIVWFGGNKIMSGTFQVGKLMSFITYITQILMSLMMLSITFMTFSRAAASSERILEVLTTESDITDSPAAKEKGLTVRKGKVEFRNVYFKYHPDSKEYVLNNINMILYPGETIAIIGATGSSKSSLVQLIPRLYEVSQGNIYIDDEDIKEYTLSSLRQSVAIVLQNNQLFSGTIKANLKWGNYNASDEEIIAAAKDAQAHDFIIALPDGYETILGQGGVNVSGGQKQRLCIARTILKKPIILILDDSTSSIDVYTESKISAALSRNKLSRSMIIIAQRISSIQHADKIIVLDNGLIAGCGPHSELIKNNLLYQEIFLSQQLKEPAV
jgi:ATP-binding cassette subfamily B protein